MGAEGGSPQLRASRSHFAPQETVREGRQGTSGVHSVTVLILPVATAVTNLEPKCPSGESRHMLGCLFWKSPAVMHSSALRK